MASPSSSHNLSDYEQGLKAANRVRIRTQMEIAYDAALPETPIDIKDEIAYLRGVFESGGVFDESAVSMFNAQKTTEMLQNLNIAYTVTPDGNTVLLSHANAHDFLGTIYKGVTTEITPKHNQFLEHIGGLAKCRIWRTTPDAVIPFKVRPSDVGFDLVAINYVKNLTKNTILLDTGIKVQVELGYYAEIVPRSSISKSGYMLANSVGIIDPGYTGNLYIALTKVDPDAPDIKLPFRGCQLIIRRQVHVDIEVMDDLDSMGQTSRGAGGFGSSG